MSRCIGRNQIGPLLDLPVTIFDQASLVLLRWVTILLRSTIYRRTLNRFRIVLSDICRIYNVTWIKFRLVTILISIFICLLNHHLSFQLSLVKHLISILFLHVLLLLTILSLNLKLSALRRLILSWIKNMLWRSCMLLYVIWISLIYYLTTAACIPIFGSLSEFALVLDLENQGRILRIGSSLVDLLSDRVQLDRVNQIFHWGCVLLENVRLVFACRLGAWFELVLLLVWSVIMAV
jgi:hypothetical protein